MQAAAIVVDKDFRVGSIDHRIFGSFIEHLGRAVYGGIYEPGHPTADDDGFRQDVLDLVRELYVPIVRYPGGNFLSGYNWEDGVGPRDQRPVRLDQAWCTTETNQFGLNEFMDWCKKANTAPMMAVNLGTRGVEEARQLVEYCNHPSGTALSDLRRSHGYAEPHGVKVWCLGNEMDGPWQIGQKTATEYGRLAAEAGKTMKLVDPTIELVACGSSHSQMPTYPDWEVEILDHTFNVADYISLHMYLRMTDAGLPTFLAESLGMEKFITTVIGIADLVAARKRSNKRINISFDEWNVWYHSLPRDREINKSMPWAVAPPLVEDTYTMADAVVFGSMMITLLRHANRVRMACLAQLVNVIAPIMTETGGSAWRHTIFYPYLDVTRNARGDVLDLRITSPTYATDKYGDAPYVDAIATIDDERDEIAFFAINRSLDSAIPVEVDVRALPGYTVADHRVLTDTDPNAANTAAQPNRVSPAAGQGASLNSNRLQVTLPALSWTAIRLTKAARG
jgi:alpha-N-arabinofuranosidase